MDPTLLHKRFKTLADYGMALKRDPSGPLVTHSTRGDMDIWQVLAFEFHSEVDKIKAVLLPQVKDERDNTSYVWSKHVTSRELQRPHVAVLKAATPDGEWTMYETWRENVSNKAPHPRIAAICAFANMGSLLWRPPMFVMAAERMGEFLTGHEEFLTISDIRVIKQWTDSKTQWIAHEPQTYTRRYVQWPRIQGTYQDTVKLDITGLEDFFVDQFVAAAYSLYRAVYGVYLGAGDETTERMSAERDLDMVISRGDLTFPGEPHVS